MNSLETKLGHVFQNKSNLERALTHASCGPGNNERMEFLGDSILNFVVADMLFELYPDIAEGGLSRMRGSLIKEATLIKVARKLDLHKHIKFVGSALRVVNQLPESAIADALEAVFAAIYKDAGYLAAREVIHRLMHATLNSADMEFGKDPKTALQEFLQGKGYALPRYEVVSMREVGAEDKRFEVACLVPELHVRAVGYGRSKKPAEHQAAAAALERCKQRR